MRRRFGRGRRTGNANDAKRAPIDAQAWLQRIVEADLTDAAALEPLSLAGVPESYAALGAGERKGGGKVLVAISPRSGGDAALAALVLGSWHGSGAGRAELLAVSPRWSGASRRLLSILRALPASLRAVELPAPGAGPSAIQPEPLYSSYAADPRCAAELIPRVDQRQLFLRALGALEGLAAKHGGAVRNVGDSVELVLLARRVAVLSVSQGRLELETRVPERKIHAIDEAGFSTLLDRLEGLLRKKLNERKVRSSEEAFRANLLPILERVADARWSAIWPLPGEDPEVIDLAAVRGDGSLLLAAARQRLDLIGLGAILEAALASEPALASLAARASVPVRPGPPELILAAKEFDGAALTALAALQLPCRAFDVRASRTGELSLEPRAALAPSAAPRVTTAPAAPPARVETAARAPREESRKETRTETRPAQTSPRQYEEISLFDLDDDTRPQAEAEVGSGRRRRRGRGRRRGRRGRSDEVRDAADERPQVAEEPEAREAEPRRDARGGRRSRAPRVQEEPADVGEQEPEEGLMLEVEDEDETLAPLSADAPDLEVAEEPVYDEEEDPDEASAEQEFEEPAERVRVAEVAPVAEPEAPPRPPRRRSAFVAHADRVSVLSAILLARDIRLVESFRIYPQDELMTFFRNVATDLREETPIFLVGFTAAPLARDTLQAASLYRGRLDWFDHHTWPPEDLQALRDAVGEDGVHVQPGTESSAAAILRQRTRRSRFSDKLVELITGRFTQHDYERWGRLWWHRAGELASTPGERRGEIDPLLAGRPSDLARHAAGVPLPPLPPELDYVSSRDFRLVHFGGYIMVVTPVPPELDCHLTARIARERYEAQLSLAYREGEEMIVLGGDEGRSRRGLDLGGMASHLVAKHEWIEALPDDDYVARVRVIGLWRHPDRLDEVVAEIAMGRSIVEG
jgi:hypothetical protein